MDHTSAWSTTETNDKGSYNREYLITISELKQQYREQNCKLTEGTLRNRAGETLMALHDAGLIKQFSLRGLSFLSVSQSLSQSSIYYSTAVLSFLATTFTARLSFDPLSLIVTLP